MAERVFAFWTHSGQFDPGEGIGLNGLTTRISIPTPAIIDSKHMSVMRVVFLFRTTQAQLRRIRVFDGAMQIFGSDNLAIEGDHLHGADDLNCATFPNPRPHISSGLAISLHAVRQPLDVGPHKSFLFVVAAGAEFVVNE